MRRLAWTALLALVACLPFAVLLAGAQPAPTVKAGISKKYGLDVQLELGKASSLSTDAAAKYKL